MNEKYGNMETLTPYSAQASQGKTMKFRNVGDTSTLAKFGWNPLASAITSLQANKNAHFIRNGAR